MAMCFYNGFPFTMYAIIVQSLGIDTSCMSEAVMRLVAGIFCYENVTFSYGESGEKWAAIGRHLGKLTLIDNFKDAPIFTCIYPMYGMVWYGMVWYGMVIIYSTSLYIIYIAHHYNITPYAYIVQYLYVAFP